MRGEKLQLVLNGAKYLPDQGIDHPSMKLAYFQDAHGPLNLPLASAMAGLTDASGHVIRTNDATTNPSSDMINAFSVGAVRIEDTVDRLDIEYTRTGGAGNSQQDSFTLLAFGRCARMLEVRNGQLRLSY